MQIGVIKTGGKQYVVQEGTVLKIEKLEGDFKKGDKVTFDEVLFSDDGKSAKMGGGKVEGTFVEAGRNQKINVIKYKAKSNYFKKRGHRQPFFKVKITKIA